MSTDDEVASKDTGLAADDILIGSVRRCARCDRELPASAFARPRTARRPGSTQCRACEALQTSASDLLTCGK